MLPQNQRSPLLGGWTERQLLGRDEPDGSEPGDQERSRLLKPESSYTEVHPLRKSLSMRSHQPRSPMLGGLTGPSEQLLSRDEPQQTSPPAGGRRGSALMELLTPEMRAMLSPFARQEVRTSSRLRRLKHVQRTDGGDSSTSPTDRPLAGMMRLSASYEQPRNHMISIPREVAAKADEISTLGRIARKKSQEVDTHAGHHAGHHAGYHAGHHPRTISPHHRPSSPGRTPTRHTTPPASLAFSASMVFKTTPSKTLHPPPHPPTSPTQRREFPPGESPISHDHPTHSQFNPHTPPSPSVRSLIRQATLHPPYTLPAPSLHPP
ncbi:hypothetical protein T484DRAFT_2177471 [Baffinella frigidus]|nr:hypothetical protein T484DRAFT_2177471 [Cryptophyta sp. CCMP2293]